MNKQRILVCGGRNYADIDHMRRVLFALDPSEICHGAASGADSLAGIVGREMQIIVTRFPADWDTHGKAAGPIRNKQMLAEFKPDLVVAFPGGRGTEHMKKIARDAGVPVVEH